MSETHHRPVDSQDAPIAHAHADHHHHPHIAHPHLNPPDAPPDALETANKHFFETIAQQYDEHPDARQTAKRIGRAMKATGLFKQGLTTVMDFACGTGLLSRELAAEDPKSIVGVDISQAMVNQYNKVVSDHGIPPGEMRAICASIPISTSTTHEHERELQGMSFDVIVCALAYHHIASIDNITSALVTAHLNPGGSLLVVDFAHGGEMEGMFPANAQHIVAHKQGFSEEQIRTTFERAGLRNVTYEVFGRAKHAGHSVDMFLARGDR